MSGAGESASIELHLAPGLAGRVRVGTLLASAVHVAPAAEPLREEIEARCRELRTRFADRSPAQIPELAPARELYRVFGIDPTKTRPSSEKLLRRVLKEKPLPRISNAVDLCNLLAVRFLLPLGLYDASKIEPPIELRPGRSGESYAGIASQEVHLQGRPALADRHGAFGNPTADSRRSAVDPSTRTLWMTVFAPATLPAPRLEARMEEAARAFRRHLAGPDRPVGTATGIVS